ncbi:class I glutamine amidotransferase-like protein [Rhodotorula sp. JG-1b]|nr:class I glutamine amidotransferase-like protein [Rhodotorula sp. JG-1b]
MRDSRVARLVASLAAAALLSLGVTSAVAAPPEILVYYATAGYYHDSIPAAIDALQNIGQTTSLYNATFSKDENLFTEEQLRNFSAIVFLSNSDQVLTDSGEAALQQWLTQGGSLVGLHAGTACLFNDTAFGTAMGSWFDYHPTIQNVTFTKLVNHSTVDPLPDRYETYEEVYHFRTDPRDVNCTVLLSYDPSTVQDPQFGTRPYYQGSPPPIAWYREGQNVDLSNGTDANPPTMTGRTWMTSLGHTIEIWSDPTHLAHVEAGLRWALEPFEQATASGTADSASGATSASKSAPSSASTGNPSQTAASTPAPTSGTRRHRVMSAGHAFAGLTIAVLALVL